MKILKVSLIGVLIIVGLVVIGIAVVNSWKQTPYGTLHTNAALLLKLIELKNIDLFGENKTLTEIRETSASIGKSKTHGQCWRREKDDSRHL